MNLEEAKQVIVAALKKAQEKGVYSFEDVSYILPAMNVLAALQEPKQGQEDGLAKIIELKPEQK